MSIPEHVLASQLRESVPNEPDNSQGPTGQLSLDGDRVAVTQSDAHLTTNDDTGVGNDDQPPPAPQPQPRFSADQLQFKTRGTGWAAFWGGLTGAGATGSGVLAGAMIGGSIGVGFMGIGAIPGIVIGGAIGGVVGLVSGTGVGNTVSRRKANGYIAGFRQRAQARGRTFSQQENANIRGVATGQWKSLLSIKSSRIGDRNVRNAVRDALIEKVATHGLPAALRLKDQLVDLARVEARDVPGMDKADRRKLQSAAVRYAAQQGVGAGQRFKQDLTRQFQENVQQYRAHDADAWVERRRTEDIQAFRVARDAADLNPTARGGPAVTALRDFLSEHLDAVAGDAFWKAQVPPGQGLTSPRMLIEHIGPQLALDVLDRAGRSGQLSARDIRDFNKAIDPDGSYGQAAPLSPELAGRDLSENLKRQMVNAIRNRYTDTADAGSVGVVGAVKMDLTKKQRRELDDVFNNDESTAQDRAAALQSKLDEKLKEANSQIVPTLQAVFPQQDR